MLGLDDVLTKALMPSGCKGKVEQVIVFTVSAWDANCNQHIPTRFDSAKVKEALDLHEKRIAELKADVTALRRVE